MLSRQLNEFIHISPGFKAAVNLKNERDNLTKVAGFVPTEVAREIILDFAKKLHPATPDLRSRIVMGTYGTGKSHLALVLLNFFLRSIETPELQTVIEKLDLDTKSVLKQYRQEVPDKYLTVSLYGDEGNIADTLMVGLCRALEREQLEYLLPPSAFDAALDRIQEVEENYPDSFKILKQQVEHNGCTLNELKTRLKEYQKKAFDLFRDTHPFFSSGAVFEYTSMLDPTVFYESIVKELRRAHNYSGIVIFWDEFGHKMEEVVKDPIGKEGLTLQDFAECCNSSEEDQLHFYLFCHRSLKEYYEISKSTHVSDYKKLEEDWRKIEGRFKQYILKSTDVETFQLIDGVIIADEQSDGWLDLIETYNTYFYQLVETTARLKYFTGFSVNELKQTVVLGTYPLHPMAVYSLPAVSEKVAQNNRTLFTCLCEDEPGSFKRFLDKASYNSEKYRPPIFTLDMLWDYFANDIKQQDRTYSVFRDFEFLKTRLDINDPMGLRVLKAVSLFRVTNPTRFKTTEEILIYALDIPTDEQDDFMQKLAGYSDLKNENHILMKLQADGSYRPAVSSATESLMEKVRKLLIETPEKLGQKPLPYLKSLWTHLPVMQSCEATGYGDDYGVYRKLKIEPISMFQLRESLHILTKNISGGTCQDGLILAVLCTNSDEIEEAERTVSAVLTDKKYRQMILAIPKEPVQLFDLLREHQALSYLKNNEASLYAEGGELYEEWKVWDDDKASQLNDTISDLFSPEKQNLVYYWQGKGILIQNNRQLKKLVSKVMREVFPHCPMIGEPKLTLDDFGGNWGYRKDCRDIIMKLADKDAADTLWKETASAPKHIITQILKSNGILYKNQAGDFVLEQPDEDDNLGANKVWHCINGYMKTARRQPIEMKNMVARLRKPPFGVKCRAMPLLFAAVVHKELALGNISFEFQRTKNKVDKITSIESDTLEKVFITPEKYRLVYVNVSSNQNALIAGMAGLYNNPFESADPPLERVKKVGNAIGAWWRALPKHAQITTDISNAADLVKKHIFKPLAELDPDTEQILLHDSFEHVFDAEKKVKKKAVETLIKKIQNEFESRLKSLTTRILAEYDKLFGEPEDGKQGLAKWFDLLPADKKNYIHNGEPAILINACRQCKAIDEAVLLEIAKRLTGLNVASWSDEMVLKFGAKLDSAKNFIESFSPPPPTVVGPPPPPPPGSYGLVLFNKGKNRERIFEISDELSSNGQTLESMLNTAVDSIGRSLDDKEKMTIFYRFISQHIFGLES
ncbi:hypothetical protein QUF75_20145 [Desulfococcaceae bacterium HSG7]|nr:hypothetical protein [Desulfococcaceae bacterium HSG7]